MLKAETVRCIILEDLQMFNCPRFKRDTWICKMFLGKHCMRLKKRMSTVTPYSRTEASRRRCEYGHSGF